MLKFWKRSMWNRKRMLEFETTSMYIITADTSVGNIAMEVVFAIKVLVLPE